MALREGQLFRLGRGVEAGVAAQQIGGPQARAPQVPADAVVELGRPQPQVARESRFHLQLDGDGAAARVRVEPYPNIVQARLQIFVRAAGIQIAGGAGVDAVVVVAGQAVVADLPLVREDVWPYVEFDHGGAVVQRLRQIRILARIVGVVNANYGGFGNFR